jgi:hypothetical protein
MQKLTTTAAIAFGVFLAIVPAQAEHGAGSVMQKGHQCYNHTKGAEDRENGFGYWSECAQGANTSTSAVSTRHKNRHSTANTAQ